MNLYRESITKFIDIWEYTYGNKTNLYELWYYISNQNGNEIAKFRDQLMNVGTDFWTKKLGRCFPAWTSDFVFISPEPSHARNNFDRWCSGTMMSKDYYASLSVLVCIFCNHSNKLVKAFPLFAETPYPKDVIINYFCEMVGIDNSYNIEKITNYDNYLVPLVFGALMHCRLVSGTNLNESFDSLDIKQIIIKHVNELNGVTNEADTATFIKTYLETLWDDCKNLDIRDIEKDKFKSFTKNIELANLYIFPTFMFDGKKRSSPVSGSSQFKRIITANSGAGKSSLIQAISVISIFDQLNSIGNTKLHYNDDKQKIDSYNSLRAKFAIEKSYFPILVRAGNFNEKNDNSYETKSLLNLAVGSSCLNFDKHFNNVIEKADQDKRLLLFVDAIDELASDRQMAFGKLIDRFIEEFPNTNLIITSRPIFYKSFYQCKFFRDIENWTLELFDDVRIKELIMKWLSNDTSVNAVQNCELIYQSFIENRFLSELARNPYMLSHALYFRTQNRNATPQEILSYIVNKLIDKRWQMQRYSKFGITTEYMRSISSYIAWEMISEENHCIPQHELVARFTNASKEVGSKFVIEPEQWDSLVKDINSRAGLLVPDQNGYIFQMSLIECYLAAEWVSNYLRNTIPLNSSEFLISEEINKLLPSEIKHSNWTDFILMIFSINASYRTRDNIGSSMFRLLMNRASLSLDRDEILNIASIMIDLIYNTFGINTVTNLHNNGESRTRQQIAKFIFNNIANPDSFVLKYLEDDEIYNSKRFLIAKSLITEREISI